MGQSVPPRILIAQDLSAMGSLSMQTALTLFQACDFSIGVLPTTILSTQSEGFGSPAILDTTLWTQQTLQHWVKEQIRFTAAIVGYYDNEAVGDQLADYLDQQVAAMDLVLVDPAFADNGEPYPLQGLAHMEGLRRLLRRATLATPNLTEACLLTNTPLFTPNPQAVRALLVKFNQLLAPGGQTVLTGLEFGDQVGVAWLDPLEGRLQQVTLPRLPGHFYGSGDTFTALLTILLCQQRDLNTAVRQATDILHEGLVATMKANDERRYGIKLGAIIATLQSLA